MKKTVFAITSFLLVSACTGHSKLHDRIFGSDKRSEETPSGSSQQEPQQEGGSVIGNGLIDLKGVKYVALSNSKLLLIDAQSRVKESTSPIQIKDVFETSQGLLIKSDTTYYHASADGTSIDLEIKVQDEYVGENKNQQLFFRSGEYFDLKDKSKKKVVSSLRNLFLQQLSGNFAIIYSPDDQVYQVLDTVGQKRFNIRGCNGPHIAALSLEMVYVNDCQENSMMNMQNGLRTPHETRTFNGETIAVDEGALAISQVYIEQHGYEYKLLLLKPDGTTRIVSNEALKPATSASNEVYNQTLFLSGDNIVVRQLGEVSHFLFSTGEKRNILQNYNVHWVDVHDNVVWFFGDDSLGHNFTGQYDLIPGQEGISPLDTRGAIIEKILKVPQ